MAAAIGVHMASEPHRVWLAKRAVYGRLPVPWAILFRGSSGDRFVYFNLQTGEETTRHPALDDPVERWSLLRRPLPPQHYCTTPEDSAGKAMRGPASAHCSIRAMRSICTLWLCPSFRRNWLARWLLMPGFQVRIPRSTDIFLLLSKRSESLRGYCSAIKMPAVEFS